MAGSRRKKGQYSAEYRRDAARLVINSGRSYRDVADELGLVNETLRKWVIAERAREEASKVKSEEPLSVRERLELEELRRKNAQLEKDVAFLKKAAAFFAKDQNR